MKPFDSYGYRMALHRIDRFFLRAMRQFGAATCAELRFFVVSAGPFDGIPLKQLTPLEPDGWPTEPTVDDWIETAERRALIERRELEGEGDRWVLTEHGATSARGWARHVGSLLRLCIAVLAWLIPLVLGSAIFDKVDWGDLWKSSAPLVALIIAAYTTVFALLAAWVRCWVAIAALIWIETARDADDFPGFDTTLPEIPAEAEA